ncbi:hypothetical protein NDU88_000524 [Pleurodeles waltl]|uniref:Uncharacterized protein n=1 Tax=Pleurodeles waltl TaxID=8319 RepID=A0AAV7TF86_PLEWA|nr:hypothetical protein NDU88_000524 [Pleurodeles waltl]
MDALYSSENTFPLVVEIELADENGQIKNLLENRHCYASEILSERETCILLAVSRPAGTTEAVFTPLLNDEDIINSKFLGKFVRLSYTGLILNIPFFSTIMKSKPAIASTVRDVSSMEEDRIFVLKQDCNW